MTFPNNSSVPAGNQQPPVAGQPVTPVAGSQVAAQAATPTAPAVDASEFAKVQQQLAEQQQLAAKLQSDLNAQKSASQRREFQLQKEMERSQRDWQQQIHQRTMAGMDDETKKQYEYELAQERLREMEETVQNLQQERAMMEAKQNARIFFAQNGVPMDKLDESGDLDALVQSGYGYLSSRIKELETRQAAPAQPPAAPPTAPVTPPTPLPAAPGVDLGAGTPPSGHPTWAAIDQEYKDKGGREAFYREYEQGLISGDRIPRGPEPT